MARTLLRSALFGLTLGSALGLLLLAGPERAAAQPMDTFGMGSRSVAMGGAVTADVEDFSANYYNPAGLVRGRQLRIGAGWFGAHHELRIDGYDTHADAVRGLVFGLAVPGQIDGFRFAFGLGVHLNDERLSRTRSLPTSRPRWEFYDSRPHRTYLAANLAIEPWSWLRIGGGISFLSYSENFLNVSGDISFLMPETESRLEHQLKGDLFSIRYPQVGVQIEPIPEVSMGVTYRGSFGLSVDLGAELDATIDAGIGTAPAYFYLLSQSVNAFVPDQISFAASVRPIRGLTVNLEATWVNWSAYISPVGSTDLVLDIDLSGLPPDIASQIDIPDELAGTRPIPANFTDRIVPRIGIEAEAYRDEILAFMVRGGYFYEQSPVPNQGGITNLVDTDRHAFSLGVGLTLLSLRPFLPGFLTFDFHFQYSHFPLRTTVKDSPIDPVGDYTANGDIFAAGLNTELGFE